MITIKIYRDKHKNIVKYQVSGHSAYAEIGSDIICAAVSSVTQMVALGLEEVLALPIELKMEENEKSSYLECRLPYNVENNIREKANILLETMVLTLKNLEIQYGEYITVLEQEV